MSEEILINIMLMELCVVVVENGVLQEVYVECIQWCGIVGNIYKGWVVWVLLGMQVVFVDIGLECVVFIYVVEIFNCEGSVVESISVLVYEGQVLVVQVIKDLIGIKGVWLIIYLLIFLCYLVYMLCISYVGIFLWIEDEVECECLKKVVVDCVVVEGIEGQGGFILCIVVEGVGEDEIFVDICYFCWLWDQIVVQIQIVGVFLVIYEDLFLVICILCDLVNLWIEKICIDL